MATVSFRALHLVRWYDVSRVLSVSSSLTTTKNYRNETWCRRWWHISQRSLSTTTSAFAPSLSPMLAKGMEDTRTAKDTKARSTMDKDTEKEEKGLIVQNARDIVSDVTVTYHRGLPKITVPLPSRKESCVFTLMPITHTVGDFMKMLRKEDRGIDRATVTTLDGVRIGSSNSIQSLMEEDFRLIINDNEYVVTPPLHHKHTMENVEKLSDLQILIGQLYETMHVREYRADMEKQVLAELEAVQLELEPLEQKLQELETTASKRANLFILSCLTVMCIQISGLARLTWWEYSWDIMEPVTYFVTYSTSIIGLIYFVVTRQESMLPDLLNRQRLLALHRRAKQAGLDVALYNRLKDRAYELETTLKIIRGPLYDHQTRMEQKKREKLPSSLPSPSPSPSSSSSSSPSRSPSSSPSPSPSPSPERSRPKKGIFSEKDTWKKPVTGNTRSTSAWTHKETRDY